MSRYIDSLYAQVHYSIDICFSRLEGCGGQTKPVFLNLFGARTP